MTMKSLNIAKISMENIILVAMTDLAIYSLSPVSLLSPENVSSFFPFLKMKFCLKNKTENPSKDALGKADKRLD